MEETKLARPRMPLAQRKSLIMTVRMRPDLSEGLAAVAVMRGTSMSGLVSQFAAEQIRCERERDPQSLDLGVTEIRSRRAEQQEQQQRKKVGRSCVEHSSERFDGLKVAAEERASDGTDTAQSLLLALSIGCLSDDERTPTHAAVATPSLLAGPTRPSFGGPEAVRNYQNLTREPKDI
jgi:hypothetical protein